MRSPEKLVLAPDESQGPDTWCGAVVYPCKATHGAVGRGVAVWLQARLRGAAMLGRRCRVGGEVGRPEEVFTEEKLARAPSAPFPRARLRNR